MAETANRGDDLRAAQLGEAIVHLQLTIPLLKAKGDRAVRERLEQAVFVLQTQLAARKHRLQRERTKAVPHEEFVEQYLERHMESYRAQLLNFD
jgi:hypothetical protein